MKILLVNPACLDTRISDEDAVSVPMGLYSVGACLKERGLDVVLVNLAESANPMDDLGNILGRLQPDMVGFSVLNATRFSAMDGARLVKERNPSAAVVFGGAGASFLADHLLTVCPELDYCVIGEGEITCLELVSHLEQPDSGLPLSISGLAFRVNGQIHHTPSRELIQDLDLLPHPGRWFDCRHVSLSRGCPGRCRFCGSPDFWGRSRVRFHSPRWFVEHVEMLSRRGITHFFVSDDTFTMDRDRVMAVCQRLTEKKLKITWAAISRVDFIDLDLVVAMRKAGCIQISFGVESGSETIRKTLGKPVKQERIVRAFDMTVQAGILPRAYFIYGSPGETRETILQSVDLLWKLKPLAAVFYVLVVFPGTGLYTGLRDKDLLSDDVWKNQVEDIPWFELDPDLDFETVAEFGQTLRDAFYTRLHSFVDSIDLLDDPELYPLHADFLSRLAMTFSHGEYARREEVQNPDGIAEALYRRALAFYKDPRAFLGLAMLLQKQRAFDQAVPLLEEGLGYFPAAKELHLCLAVSLMNLGQFDRALSSLEPFRNDPYVQPYVQACLKASRGES